MFFSVCVGQTLSTRCLCRQCPAHRAFWYWGNFYRFHPPMLPWSASGHRRPRWHFWAVHGKSAPLKSRTWVSMAVTMSTLRWSSRNCWSTKSPEVFGQLYLCYVGVPSLRLIVQWHFPWPHLMWTKRVQCRFVYQRSRTWPVQTLADQMMKLPPKTFLLSSQSRLSKRALLHLLSELGTYGGTRCSLLWAVWCLLCGHRARWGYGKVI